VQHKLLDLYVSQHMSSSVKLHIINALDQTTRLKEGLDWLLGRHHLQVGTTVSNQAVADMVTTDVISKAKMKNEYVTDKMNCVGQPAMLTGYQRIIGIMLTKQVCIYIVYIVIVCVTIVKKPLLLSKYQRPWKMAVCLIILSIIAHSTYHQFHSVNAS